MVVVAGHVEADGGHLGVSHVFLDQVQFEVYAGGPHFAAVAKVVKLLREEYGIAVAGAEGLELPEDTRKLGRNL